MSDPDPTPFFGLDRSREPHRFTRSFVRRGFLSHVLAFLRAVPRRLREEWAETGWEP